jgi:hypothetical protein
MEREVCGCFKEGDSPCGKMADWLVIRDASPDGATQACSEHLSIVLNYEQPNQVSWIGGVDTEREPIELDLASIAARSFAEVAVMALVIALMVLFANIVFG